MFPWWNSQAVVDRLKPSVGATSRVLVAMLLVQIPGAAIGWWLAPIGKTFFDLWYGAAIALPFVFAIGLLWQKRAIPDSILRHRIVIVGYGLFSFLLPIYGYLTYDIWSQPL